MIADAARNAQDWRTAGRQLRSAAADRCDELRAESMPQENDVPVKLDNDVIGRPTMNSRTNGKAPQRSAPSSTRASPLG